MFSWLQPAWQAQKGSKGVLKQSRSQILRFFRSRGRDIKTNDNKKRVALGTRIFKARSVIVGSSVHNQRVERHNRAANEQELSVFREEFYQLESEGLLNPLNETDLFCLHYVYLPRINKSVSEFITAHNNHSVSTENNNTPAQMFWLNLQLTAFHGGFPEDAVWRGISVNELLTPDLPHVQVPETRSPLTEADTEALRSAIDPLSSTNGKELYIQTLRFVGIRLQQN